MGGDVLHADDPGHIAGHLYHHVGELERHGKGIIKDQDPRVAHARPTPPQRPAAMYTGHVFLVRPNLIHLVDVEVAKRCIKRMVRFVHFFDAFFQHARLLTSKMSPIILQSWRRGRGGEWRTHDTAVLAWVMSLFWRARVGG